MHPNPMRTWAAAATSLLLIPALTDLAAGDDSSLEQALKICAAYPDDALRLQCYDVLAKPPTASSATPTSVADKGKWLVATDTNPVDDTKTVTAYLQADSGEGTFGDPVTFIARCKSNQTEAYINWNTYLASDSGDVYSDWKNVTVRIGTAPKSEQRWPTSTDSKATFAPDWAGTLLKAMAKADRFVAVVTPYSESPITAVFDTRGMVSALVDLTATCKWTLD